MILDPHYRVLIQHHLSSKKLDVQWANATLIARHFSGLANTYGSRHLRSKDMDQLTSVFLKPFLHKGKPIRSPDILWVYQSRWFVRQLNSTTHDTLLKETYRRDIGLCNLLF